MLFPVIELLREITTTFQLKKGDIVLTGTPKGVGRLSEGDALAMSLSLSSSGTHTMHDFSTCKVVVCGG